jgi:cobalt/nickel transport system permease protein
MSGGHAHGLFVHTDGPLHRLPAECKVVALVVLVIAFVATPPAAVWAFGVFLLLLAALAQAERVPFSFLGRRMLVEVPFLLFAMCLPFVAAGPRTDVLGIALSEAGILAAWNIVAKATLSTIAILLLAASTEMAAILRALHRLKIPSVLIAIAGFMVRYADVVTGEARRMRIARESRAYDPRWFWQARALAASSGTLFIRSFERGERVHLAMLARGFDGTFPRSRHEEVVGEDWLVALTLPAVCTLIAASAWVA